jgi:hypothetical protein
MLTNMNDDLTTTRELLNHQLDMAVTDDPLQALTTVGALERDVDSHRRTAVRGAIQHHTWAEIGSALGVTKQAAHHKFAKEWAETLKAEIKAESDVYKRALRAGDGARAADAKTRLDAVIGEFKNANRRRKKSAA